MSDVTDPYVGHCSKCDKLLELSTATGLCEKCTPKPKKEDSDGS